MIDRHRIRTSLVLFLLLTFLLSWTKDGLACLCFNILDDHHDTSLSLMHGEIHLVLSHSEENNNFRVAADLEEHGHSLLDRTTDVFDADHHSSHEFHIDLCSLQVTEAVRTVEIPKIVSPIVISYMAPAPDKFSPASFISKPYPEVNITLISHHATVLLI